MAATQPRPQAEDDDGLERDIGRDEEEKDVSPHDVPDETVIEKTLPSRPGGARGGPAHGSDA